MAEERGRWQPPVRERRSASTTPSAAAGPGPGGRWKAGSQRGKSAYTVPRSQQWLFAVMVVLVVAMAISLLRLRARTAERLAAAAEPLPITALGGPQQQIELYLARDRDGTLFEKPVLYPLPADRNARARVVLEKLLEVYTSPGSEHPLHPSPGVEQVFLLPVPGGRVNGARLAVVNLSAGFALTHPSGIEPESLTLLSMIATLHANLPEVAEVRFLVDGAQRATLAGHAELGRAYLAAGTEMNAATREEEER